MARLLLVDDDPVNLKVMADCLASQSNELHYAEDGLEAWERLAADPDGFDALILDRLMPRMDGMEVLRRIKAESHLDDLPVIMQTAADSDREVEEGLAAGAWYYLAKPYNCTALNSIVLAALMDRDHRRQLVLLDAGIDAFLKLTNLARYRFRTPDQARHLASVLARCCPGRPAVALGLSELMLNAIEHGNLGFSYDDKSQLMADGTWVQAVERRLAQAQQADRWAELEFHRDADRLLFTIQDLGEGFDWRNFLVMDPKRAFDSHGRGIALANTLAFSSLQYQGCGNRVQATVLPGDNP